MHIDFIIGRGIVQSIATLMRADQSVFIITDTNLKPRVEKLLIPHLINKKQHIIETAPGEISKSFEKTMVIIEKIIELAPNRDSVIIAFGGGVITDMAGFIASILLRGLQLINVPSSLLAQVDSGIGGKNGLNTKVGKNLIGTIYNPLMTIIDIQLLSTLPRRELISGYAEIVKSALINDPIFFTWLDVNFVKILNRDFEALEYAIMHACQIKKKLIQNDLFDTQKQRLLLNFGHTIGHAIESHNKYEKVTHGEAVSLGIAFATQISEKLTTEEKNKIISHLLNTGLPTDPLKFQAEWKTEEILQKIQRDKKVREEGLNFIKLSSIGKAYVQTMQPHELIPHLQKFFSSI